MLVLYTHGTKQSNWVAIARLANVARLEGKESANGAPRRKVHCDLLTVGRCGPDNLRTAPKAYEVAGSCKGHACCWVKASVWRRISEFLIMIGSLAESILARYCRL